MSIKEIRTAKATDLQNNFGAHRDMAQREPIAITNHGRVSAVLISAAVYEEYERLKQYDTRQHRFAEDLTPDQISEIEKAGMAPKHDHLNDLMK